MAAKAGGREPAAWAAPTSGKLAIINPRIWPAYAQPLIKTSGGGEDESGEERAFLRLFLMAAKLKTTTKKHPQPSLTRHFLQSACLGGFSHAIH